MNLPKKDKNGNSYISYSQLSSWLRDKNEYIETYFKGKPFVGNAYTDFGSKVGEAIEKNDFAKFSEPEAETLKKATRLHEFEKRCRIKYDDFYVVGYIDTVSKNLDYIIDYKTGGKNKELQYKYESYFQLDVYALAIRQEHCVEVKGGHVEFIRRSGNAFKGEKLRVDGELIKIPVDLSTERITRTYWNIKSITEDISKAYEKYIQEQ